MIENILSVSFNILMRIVFLLISLVTEPIDDFIELTLPSIGDALSAVGTYLDIIASGLGWAISASGIPVGMIALIGYFFIFKLTVPLNLYFIKLAAKYWVTFKR